jgi:DNA-binding MarR family transcriptional regulator
LQTIVIVRLLGFASKISSEVSEKILEPSGLTLIQWVVLTALWRKDGLTIGEIATYYRATEPSTSNLIARMEKKGLLERRHDMEDRRQVRVFLTEEGSALSHLIDYYKDINSLLLDGFDEQEKDQFAAMLERIIKNARGELNGNKQTS